MSTPHNAPNMHAVCTSARPLALACLLLGLALALAAWLDGDTRHATMLLTTWAGASVSVRGCARRRRARHISSTESR